MISSGAGRAREFWPRRVSWRTARDRYTYRWRIDRREQMTRRSWGGCPWRASANKAEKVRLYIAARPRDIIILCSFVTTNWVTPAQTPRQSAAICVWTTLVVRYASRGRSANVNPRTIPSSCDGSSTCVGNRSTRPAVAGGWSVDSQTSLAASCFLRFAWSFDTISSDIIGMEVPYDSYEACEFFA